MKLETLSSLKLFCDLAQTRTFKQAAQLNGVTLSAVSQQITALERRFKALLFERSQKHFRLTREGEVLYDHSRQILATRQALHERLQALKGSVSGTIRLAAIYSVGLYDLPPYLTRFLKRWPTVNIHVEYRHADQIYRDVKSNAVDLGLVAYPGRDEEIETVVLRQEPMILVCRPEHRFAKLERIDLEALDGQNLVSFEPQMRTRKALDKELRAHRVAVRHVMEFDNIETVKSAVEVGAGIAVVPRGSVAREVAGGALAGVPLANGGLSRPLAAIYRKSRVLSPAMRQLLALLQGNESAVGGQRRPQMADPQPAHTSHTRCSKHEPKPI